MKFCIVLVHDLTNDIGYDAMLKRYKNAILGVKHSKCWGKIAGIGKISVVSILFIYWYNILHSGSSYIK